jgi:mono/diheme cytochrome c family protein
MRKVLKWIGIVLGGLVGLALVAVGVLYVWTESKLNERYTIPVEQVAIPTDAASIARGQHLATSVFVCNQCHGPDLSGGVLFEDPLTGRLSPSNLTPGKGGVGQAYTDEDWVRAIRHGVMKDGRAGIAMLSNLFYKMNDEDLGAMIAYLKHLPPVDHEVPRTQLGLMGRVFLLQAEDDMLPAKTIDHTAPRPVAPAVGITAEYGHYLAGVCTLCHGENYAGITGEGNPANLTPAGDLAHWTLDEFRTTLRTGTNPAGHALDPEQMPWKYFGQMTDDELAAVFVFLQSLPPEASKAPGGP